MQFNDMPSVLFSYLSCLFIHNLYNSNVLVEKSHYCIKSNWCVLQETLEQEVKGLEERVSAIQQLLGDLKVQLYAKFGNNINLEADES